MRPDPGNTPPPQQPRGDWFGRIRRPIIRVLLLLLLLTALMAANLLSDTFSDAYAVVQASMTLEGDEVHFASSAYPKGDWDVRVKGFTPTMAPGQRLTWRLRCDIGGGGWEETLPELKKVAVALAARRMNDKEGRFRSQNGYFYSTYLTRSGLPIEGYQYFIANSRVGGPYKTPLDHFQELSPGALKIDGQRLTVTASLEHQLAADFPPGLYRVEVALLGMRDGIWRPLQAIRDASSEDDDSDEGDYSDHYFKKLFMPPMRVGEMKQPRAIWTLFTTSPSLGTAGIVAAEDAAHFALTRRTKLPVRYILPCHPGPGGCERKIEPDLPAAFISGFGNTTLEPDLTRGQATVKIKRPDGEVVDLGTRPFKVGLLDRLHRSHGLTLHSGHSYEFKQWGRYQITMTGQMYDRYGNSYAGGGTYEVWRALPLTFATGIKPGTPMKEGGSYSVAATINPPVPARVEARVTYYPGGAGGEPRTVLHRGRAQRFGYFQPDSSTPPLRFPGPGEYLFDIFATHEDASGRIYMGHMKNASVVLPAEPNLEIHGRKDRRKKNTRVNSFSFTREANTYNVGPTPLPWRSGDQFYLAGNGPFHSFISTSLSVKEPTGALAASLKQNFPPSLVRLSEVGTDHAPGATPRSSYAVLPTSFDDYHSSGPGERLPLLSTTTPGYSPFEYPELVNRAGYFYMASSRPGFSVFFVVGDSTVYDNHWYTQYTDFEGTLGAARRGDQPGDVYWTVATGLFHDSVKGQGFYGRYGSGGVVLRRGDDLVFQGKPFSRPVATINGETLEIYGGVGPAPGTLYETGALKGIGSLTVPMVPHHVMIQINKPGGEIFSCQGRADAIGNFACPEGPLSLDEAGVYRMRARFSEGGHTGAVAGARDGWFQFYAVDRESKHRVLFTSPAGHGVKVDDSLLVQGQVDPALSSGEAYYSVVTPGILLDEGRVPLRGGKFSFKVLLGELTAQFPNIHDHPRLPDFSFWRRCLSIDGRALKQGLTEKVLTVLSGGGQRALSDTVEVTVFVKGGEGAAQVTAGGKFVLRGGRVMVPARFRQRERR